jgi:hypothetical protein
MHSNHIESNGVIINEEWILIERSRGLIEYTNPDLLRKFTVKLRQVRIFGLQAEV